MEEPRLVGRLVTLLLESVLKGQPYPGQTAQTSSFPDIEVVRGRDEILVSTENLEKGSRIEVPGANIRLLPREQIFERAASEPLPFFSVTNVKLGEDQATLSLQLSWAKPHTGEIGEARSLGGGGVRVRFVKTEAGWQAPDGPLATWIS